MSKRSVASRRQSTNVVPLTPSEPPWTPLDRARADFSLESELLASRLRGMRELLYAWSVHEREGSLPPDLRDAAFGFLGDAVELMGERLEAKRMAWWKEDRAGRTKSA